LKEITIHGRGGQGAVTSSQILAVAAFYDGKECQAFPMFGVERRGAPVEAFARISDKPITLRSQVYNPNYIMVLDSTLLANGSKILETNHGAKIFINSSKNPKELGSSNGNVFSVDVTKKALEIIGKPFVNIGMLGAFSALSGEISLPSLEKAILEVMGSNDTGEKNRKLAVEVFNSVKKQNGGN